MENAARHVNDKQRSFEPFPGKFKITSRSDLHLQDKQIDLKKKGANLRKIK